MSKFQQKMIDALEYDLKKAKGERDESARLLAESDLAVRQLQDSRHTATIESNAAARAAKVAAAAAEAATLASIKAGLIPVADLRKVVSASRIEFGEHSQIRTDIDIEVHGKPNAVQQAILDALTPSFPSELKVVDGRMTFDVGPSFLPYPLHSYAYQRSI